MYGTAKCVFPVEVSYPLKKWSFAVAVNVSYVVRDFKQSLWSLVQLDYNYLYSPTSGVKRDMKGGLLYQSRQRNGSYVRLFTN